MTDKKDQRKPPSIPTPPGDPEIQDFLDDLAKEMDPPKDPPPERRVDPHAATVPEMPAQRGELTPGVGGFMVSKEDEDRPKPSRRPTREMPAAMQDALTVQTIRRPRILIIDDDEDICNVLKQILEEDAEPPFEVFLAHNGLQGVKKMDELRAENRKPDCVLLDLTMPEYDGWTYIGFAERCWMIDVPFRLISAMHWDEPGRIKDPRWVFLERYRRGGYEILRKPFRGGPEQIIQTVQDCVGTHMGKLPP